MRKAGVASQAGRQRTDCANGAQQEAAGAILAQTDDAEIQAPMTAPKKRIKLDVNAECECCEIVSEDHINF